MNEKNDSQRYLESFIQEIKDYKELSTVQFYIKYCLSWNELKDIDNEYKKYLEYNDTEYDEWLENIYYYEYQTEIDDRIYEYRINYLDFIEYKSSLHDRKIFELTLAFWWPNIYLNISTRWNKVIYEFYWWWEIIKEDLSYLYDYIISYFSIEE